MVKIVCLYKFNFLNILEILVNNICLRFIISKIYIFLKVELLEEEKFIFWISWVIIGFFRFFSK